MALYLRSIIIGFLLAVGVASLLRIPPLTGPPPRQPVSPNIVRDSFVASLKRIVPEPHAAFVLGTIIGTTSDLPQSIKNDFARTSTSHIIAVSGYNITIIAQIVAAVLAVVMRRSRAFWFTAVVLIAFMIITGAQASVVRATIMGLYVLLARYFGRLPSPTHGLLLAAGIMVALEPRILAYDIGFQLSFLATAGIFYIVPLIEDRLPRIAAVPVIGEIFAMTLSAQIAVLPLLIYYFHSLSIISLPINIIVLPLVPFIMISGFIAGVLALAIPILGTLAASIPHLLSYIVLTGIHWASSLSWAAVTYNFSFLTVLFIYFGMAIFIAGMHLDMNQDM